MKHAAIVRGILGLMICLFPPAIRAGEALLSGQDRQEIEQRQEERRREVFSEYRKRLDERFRTSETEGDIDLMVLIADERDEPGSGPAPVELLAERDGLQEALLRLERARLEDILEKIKAAEMRDEEAIEELERQIAAPLLGVCILPPDAFSTAQRMEWRVRMPRGRSENRTGLHMDEVEQVQTFRMHQDSRNPLMVSRDLTLLAGADYELTWRARSVQESADEDIAPESGAYSIGFGISDVRYQSLPASEKARLTRTVQEIAPAPLHREWQEQRGVLRAGRHMDQLIFRISSGGGEWEIRDLQIRRLYPEE